MPHSKRRLPVIQAEAVLRSLPEGTIVTDAQSHVRFINTRAAEIFALDPAEAVGRLFGDVISHREINASIHGIIASNGAWGGRWAPPPPSILKLRPTKKN